MSSSQGAIIMLTKHPFVGQVKTRIGKEVGFHHAADLSWAMAQDTLTQLQHLQPQNKCVIALDQPISFLRSFKKIQIINQGAGDLGQRLERLASQYLQKHPWVIFVGSDTPHLSLDVYQESINLLNRSQNVLGPAVDGGYYLQGLLECPKGLFTDITWSSPKTCMQMYKAQQKLLVQDTVVLEKEFDVDQVTDVEKLREYSLPHTSKILKRIYDEQ